MGGDQPCLICHSRACHVDDRSKLLRCRHQKSTRLRRKERWLSERQNDRNQEVLVFCLMAPNQ